MRYVIHNHFARDVLRPSGAWQKAMVDPTLKSYEVAGANAKELYRLRKEIDKAEQDRNQAKVAALKEVYEHVQSKGSERHQNMPVHGVMQNTSRVRDKAGNSLGEQARAMHKRYLKARSDRLLFENTAHRGGEDATKVLENRAQASKYRTEELNLLKQYNELVQSAILKGDQ